MLQTGLFKPSTSENVQKRNNRGGDEDASYFVLILLQPRSDVRATKVISSRKQKRDRYHNHYKLDEEKAEKYREKSRARRKAKSEQQANEILSVLDRLPPKTSKFASEVFAEVCKALASYNIRYKAEFNYLGHKLYPRSANISNGAYEQTFS